MVEFWQTLAHVVDIQATKQANGQMTTAASSQSQPRKEKAQEHSGHKLMEGHCDNSLTPVAKGGSRTNAEIESIDTQRTLRPRPNGAEKVSSLRIWLGEQRDRRRELKLIWWLSEQWWLTRRRYLRGKHQTGQTTH